MSALLTILVCLFAALFVTVKLTEKYAKPMAPEQQQKLSKVLVILVAVTLLASALNFYFGG